MLQFLKSIRRAFIPSPEQLRANRLYNVAVAQSRRPGFYLDAAVTDTLDGRFDMMPGAGYGRGLHGTRESV